MSKVIRDLGVEDLEGAVKELEESIKLAKIRQWELKMIDDTNLIGLYNRKAANELPI